jgi:hypothetical protein
MDFLAHFGITISDWKYLYHLSEVDKTYLDWKTRIILNPSHFETFLNQFPGLYRNEDGFFVDFYKVADSRQARDPKYEHMHHIDFGIRIQRPEPLSRYIYLGDRSPDSNVSYYYLKTKLPALQYTFQWENARSLVGRAAEFNYFNSFKEKIKAGEMSLSTEVRQGETVMDIVLRKFGDSRNVLWVYLNGGYLARPHKLPSVYEAERDFFLDKRKPAKEEQKERSLLVSKILDRCVEALKKSNSALSKHVDCQALIFLSKQGFRFPEGLKTIAQTDSSVLLHHFLETQKFTMNEIRAAAENSVRRQQQRVYEYLFQFFSI